MGSSGLDNAPHPKAWRLSLIALCVLTALLSIRNSLQARRTPLDLQTVETTLHFNGDGASMEAFAATIADLVTRSLLPERVE